MILHEFKPYANDPDHCVAELPESGDTCNGYPEQHITRAMPADAGCYVDGWWGQYAVAHMIMRATEFGYDDSEAIDLAERKLAEMYPQLGEILSDNEHEILSDASDDAEAWLNDHVAPEGYSFGWSEGEFYLWSDEQWEETS